MKRIYVYYAVMSLSGLISIAKTGLYAKLLGTVGMGYYSLLMILSTYSMNLCSFGLYEGSMGILPILYGEGNQSKAEFLRNKTASFMLVSLLIAIIIVIVFVSIYSFDNWLIRITVFFAVLFGSIFNFFLLLLADLRARMMTYEFGCLIFVRSISSLALGSLSIYYYGYLGIPISETLITLILIVITLCYFTKNFKFDFSHFFKLKPMFNVGLPLMFTNITGSLAPNLNQFFVLKAFNTNTLGKYNFALLIDKGFSMIRSIVYQYLGPKILYEIGQGKNPKNILIKIHYLSVFFLLLILFIWYPFNWIVNTTVLKYFSEYKDITNITNIIYFGSGISLISNYDNFTVASKQTKHLLILQISIVLLSTILLSTALLLKLNLKNYAYIFVLSRFLYLSGSIFIAHWSVEKLVNMRKQL